MNAVFVVRDNSYWIKHINTGFYPEGTIMTRDPKKAQTFHSIKAAMKAVNKTKKNFKSRNLYFNGNWRIVVRPVTRSSPKIY